MDARGAVNDQRTLRRFIESGAKNGGRRGIQQ
jgi:hypothetical protein